MAEVSLQPIFDQALQHHQAGRLHEAEQLYRQILAQEPNHADALHMLGLIALQAGHNDLAMEIIRRAIALKPNNAESHNNLGVALVNKEQWDDAIAAFHQAIALKPSYAEACNNLGRALVESERFDEAIAACRQAIALKPDFPKAYNNLGWALIETKQLDEAIAACRRAIVLQPNLAEAHNHLGWALIGKGQLDEAIAACRHAIALKPDLDIAHSNLGVALIDKGQLDEAIAACRKAIALKPDCSLAYSNLGTAWEVKGQLDEAIAAYRQAIDLQPNYPLTYRNLGTTLVEKGQLDEAIAAYRKAIALKPNFPEAHSNLVLMLHYHPGYDAQALAAEHRRWNQQHAEPLKKYIQPHANDRNPDRRLRIGYVSPDFRNHSVAPMVLPLLASHDHSNFEVFCYAQVLNPDAMTTLFRSHADQWRNTVGLSDQQMAEMIRQDQIDLLIDLAGHTAKNRLLVFARKPAPVQITRQGYPDTTGLTTIDYRMTDAYADPPGLSDTLHSEKLIRLAPTNWIYQPPQEALGLSLDPLAPEEPVTFGCFNFFAKITEPMLRIWASILAAVPHSRLLLKAAALNVADVEHRVREIFTCRGIARERLEICGLCPTPIEHLTMYNRLAIALDSFPYHGTTTTCEALWMGVPVITLAGQTHVSRVGVSLLTNMGLPELIADSPEAYIRIAVELAHDRSRLRHLHSTLRQRIKDSPLMDAPRFARNVEATYRQMWRQWCAKTPQASAIRRAMLDLSMRSRVELPGQPGQFKVVQQAVHWDPQKSAVVICDMWDNHWCKSATARVAEMAPRMNHVIGKLRDQGVLIVHSPGDTMPFYENHPGRKLADAAPPAPGQPRRTPATKEGPFPIDFSDGGSDDEPPSTEYVAWRCQIASLEIKAGDAISDSDQVYFLLRQHSIENVLIMGVHANLCVLNRPYGIRAMVNRGMNVALMRDLTDVMYNPKKPPFVDHFTGVDLVVAFIERYWCPTLTSDQVLGGEPFRFAADRRTPEMITAATLATVL